MDKWLVEALKAGEIGVLPTDTMYGLVGSALSKKVVERIYHVRERNPKKPFIILIDSVGRLADFGITLSGDSKNPLLRILKKLWPDKITVILPCKSKKFEYLHRGLNKLSFRIPDHARLRALLKKTGPLVAPSANPEGKPPAKTIKQAEDYFGAHINFYVDQRKLKDVPSTIIEIDDTGKVSLIREGAVPFKRIVKSLL